jgi:hypothetical protein
MTPHNNFSNFHFGIYELMGGMITQIASPARKASPDSGPMDGGTASAYVKGN